MSRGGYRPGAGRKKAQVALAEAVLGTGRMHTAEFETALEFAMTAINDPAVSMTDKIRLACAAMPYQHARQAELGKKAAAEVAAATPDAGSLLGQLMLQRQKTKPR